MLYTVHMLNRFNAISVNFAMQFSFLNFLASKPMSMCRPGQARWMYEQLFAFFNSHHWESFQAVVRQGITLQYVLNIISEKGRTLMKLRNRQSHPHRQVCATSPRHSWCFSIKTEWWKKWKVQYGWRVMVLITRWNMMLCEYSWPLCTVRFCSHLIFLRTVYVWRQRKWWKYFKLRYGYLLWFSTLSHFSFCVFFNFQKKTLPVDFSF